MILEENIFIDTYLLLPCKLGPSGLRFDGAVSMGEDCVVVRQI